MSNRPFNRPPQPLAAGFAESCSLFADRPALCIQNTEFSYAQLLAKTEQVFTLFNNTVPGLVGIYIHDSVWTYAAILAVSLSGACYVPLNPKLPAHRLQAMIHAAQLSLILTEVQIPFAHAAKEMRIDPDLQPTPCKPLIDQELAYLLFTSGTTGEPKGAPISKRNAAAFFEHYRRHYDFNAQDRFLQPYELSFDVSVFAMFAAWNAGACVCCVPDEGPKYIGIVNTLKEQRITVSSMVPTVLLYLEKYLPGFSFPQLRYSFFSGDKLYQHLAELWQQAVPNGVIHNCYGPTETTIVCTWYVWDKQRSKAEAYNNIVPLGKPFEDMHYLLVDEKSSPVTQGSGELCWSGPQVMDAYLNNLHPEKFFLHNQKHYYKSGDLAELNASGNLVFHGRVDTQVKINGFRIELAEVEHAVAQASGANVIVLPVETQQLTSLTAFIESETLNTAALKKKLEQLLPDYMMPSHYIAVSAFPRNINGKIDRRQLKTQL